MQFRSTTDEMLAARFDPEPYVTEDGKRQATSEVPYRLGGRTYADYAPRVECIPSRPEYARPEPNPILGAFRGRLRYQSTASNPVPSSRLAEIWLSDLSRYGVGDHVDATPAHVEHARKVLTRLANVYKEA